MGTLTSHYQLAAGVAIDDVIAPEHQNRLAEVLDRVVGRVVKKLLTAGVHEGWELSSAGEVGAGSGLVGGCWCETAEAQEIGDLTSGAVNYVYAVSEEDSAPAGSVAFLATLSSTPPGEAVYLGTVEVDGQGAIVAVDSAASGVARQCWPLQWGQARGEGTVEGVEAQETVSVTVAHGVSFRVPGALSVESESANFRWTVRETHEAEGFTLEVTNEGMATADFEYTWVREGFVGE
jgi:hypothetical protein